MRRTIYKKKDDEVELGEGSSIEEKVYFIADQVLDILRNLSQDNKKQLSTKMIADRMSARGAIKKILSDCEYNSPANQENKNNQNEADFNSQKKRVESILAKFAKVVPSSVNEKLSMLRNSYYKDDNSCDADGWLDSSLTVIQKYIHSVAGRNMELEEFMHQAMQYLKETERRIEVELFSNQSKFKQDREFEEGISSNMNVIKQDFSISDNYSSGDLQKIKMAVLSRIENINKNIDKKREVDMLQLEESQKNLELMTARITDIKREAEIIKEKAQEIEMESLHDRLTGAFNRKAYDQKIAETLADMRRYGVVSSLLICDIDDFKKINDTYGHKVGDLALKKLVSLFRERLRITDFISRYGGEEFAIILTHTDLSGAVKAAEGLVSFINKSIFSYQENKIPLTISIGASLFKEADDASTVFERADSALYLAKRSGKNTVKTEEDCGVDVAETKLKSMGA
ncbi:MAG: diguanylate cyclase [Nitrospirota bacterium]